MRIKLLELETPTLVSVEPVAGATAAAQLNWKTNEDADSFGETDIFCRLPGESVWHLSALSNPGDQEIQTGYLASGNGEEVVLLEKGKEYEFCVQLVGPKSKYVQSGSDLSNVVRVQL